MADRAYKGESSAGCSPQGASEGRLAEHVTDQARSANAVRANLVVVDNFPPMVPIPAAELDAIETYIGSLVDAICNAAEVQDIAIKERPPGKALRAKRRVLERH